MNYNMDRLYEMVMNRGHVCVGLDTAAEYLPLTERRRFSSAADAVLAYNRAIIDATLETAACYKVQIAYYEEMGIAGLQCYAATLKYLRERGAPVIADIKRGDIADTAERYARAHFEGDFEADFVTLSPYMGMDSIEPWIKWADSRGKGAFVLMRTSNKGMRDFQYPELDAGETGRRNRRVYHIVGERLKNLATARHGVHGYGVFGAVVGCTERDEAAEIRELFPNLFFLIPGYGAQGGAADDAALLLRNGNGGVVNASRSILKAWSREDLPPEEARFSHAADAARKAAEEMRDALRKAVEKST